MPKNEWSAPGPLTSWREHITAVGGGGGWVTWVESSVRHLLLTEGKRQGNYPMWQVPAVFRCEEILLQIHNYTHVWLIGSTKLER